MQPLSRWKRRLYLYSLAALFFILVPIVFLYAAGYRYRSGIGFVQTGAIFVTVGYSGAQILLDGAHIGTSGILNRNFYVDNLAPGAYTLEVSHEAYRPWSRMLVVEQNLVSTAAAFLLPEKIDVMRLTTATSTDSAGSPQAATSTESTISVVQRSTYLQAFSAHASTTAAGASEEQGGEGLFLEHGNVYVRWLRQSASPPDNFCGRPSYCALEIPIERGPETATRAAFYAGGVVYRTKEEGVFIVEADVRPNPVSAPLYPKPGADFVIVGSALIIKDGSALYEIQGL